MTSLCHTGTSSDLFLSLPLCLSPNLHDQDPRDSIIKSGAIPRNVPPGPHKDLPIIHVRVTHNNTVFTVTDSAGRVLAWTSAVSCPRVSCLSYEACSRKEPKSHQLLRTSGVLDSNSSPYSESGWGECAHLGSIMVTTVFVMFSEFQ